MVHVQIFFPLKSDFSNIFLVKAFRAHQRQAVPMRLINVDVTPEQHFAKLYDVIRALFRWSHAALIILQHKSFDFPASGVAHCSVTSKGPAHANSFVISRYLSNLQIRFVISNHYTVNCTLAKEEKTSWKKNRHPVVSNNVVVFFILFFLVNIKIKLWNKIE